ncbi:MAG TPA: Nif3-like dinuclear metal center hexameric protein [Firmicutes bacterium]|nr:Nif3-like dinuclear metal center hexameric protein [Bacillota bacterium]
MPLVKDFYQALDSLAPFETAESYDNAGLLVGDFQSQVHTCAVALDLTEDTIRYAQKEGADLMVSHHPIIFHPIKHVRAGSAVYRLARSGMHAICAHTNLDLAWGGTNDVLCEMLELTGTTQLTGEQGEEFCGRIGKLPRPMQPEEFAAYVSEKLGGTIVRYSNGGKEIRTVGLCTGHGASFAWEAFRRGADAFVTAEVKHDQMIDARAMGLTLVDAGHLETEDPVVDKLLSYLQEKFPSVHFVRVPREILGISSACVKGE